MVGGGGRFYVTRPTSLSADTGSRGKNERHHGAGLNREGPSISMYILGGPRRIAVSLSLWYNSPLYLNV